MDSPQFCTHPILPKECMVTEKSESGSGEVTVLKASQNTSLGQGMALWESNSVAERPPGGAREETGLAFIGVSMGPAVKGWPG